MTINWQKRILLWSKRCSWKSILLYCIIQYIVPDTCIRTDCLLWKCMLHVMQTWQKSGYWFLHFDFPLGASRSGHLCAVYVLANICLCARGREGFKRKMCICLNIGLYGTVGTMWMVNVLKSLALACLAVADTAMSRGCLIFPVNPVSQSWSCQRKQRRGVT